MARLTEDADYDVGETSGNVPRPHSDCINAYAHNGLRTRCILLSLSANMATFRKEGTKAHVRGLLLSETSLADSPLAGLGLVTEASGGNTQKLGLETIDVLTAAPGGLAREDVASFWYSEVEMTTHMGPLRRVWMGPQFTFKTYQESLVGVTFYFATFHY
ncbi:unnamed protein product [Protopolystoma xenopodis]|uniref:Uncharacterized protein n=1 Tax=Protopolystoma xenopodis TaxID=117903 RepID=A0A3S5AVW1_9PLAT|nr:unnamed protein product [Protopolystoma xenopodis]